MVEEARRKEMSASEVRKLSFMSASDVSNTLMSLLHTCACEEEQEEVSGLVENVSGKVGAGGG